MSIPAGALAIWHLDETSGTVALDSSGNGYNGELSELNVSWDSGGKKNGCCKFVPSGLIDLKLGVSQIGNDWSISFWLKMSSNPSTYWILTTGDGGSYFQLYGNGQNIGCYTTPESSYWLEWDSCGLADNVWHHVVITMDKTIGAGESKLYIDKVLKNTGRYPGLVYPSGTLRVGNRGDGYGGYNGLLDEVIAYQRVLTDEEVTQLYNDAVITKVETPVIAPAAGTYEETVNVSMTCSTSGALIYYTLDGTDPDETDILYIGPFDLITTKTVKAIGIKSGLPNSDIATSVFTITYHAPEPGLNWVPINPRRNQPVHFTPDILDPYSRFASVDYEIDGSLEFVGKAIDFEFDWEFLDYQPSKTVTQIIHWDAGSDITTDFIVTMTLSPPIMAMDCQPTDVERTKYDFISLSSADVPINHYWWEIWQLDVLRHKVTLVFADDGDVLNIVHYDFLTDADFRIILRMQIGSDYPTMEVDITVGGVTPTPSGQIEIDPNVWQLVAIPIKFGYWDILTHALIHDGITEAKIKNYVVDQLEDKYGSPLYSKIEVFASYIGDVDAFYSFYPDVTPPSNPNNFPLIWSDIHGGHDEVVGFWIKSKTGTTLYLDWGTP